MSGSRIPLKPDQGPDRTAAGASVTAERQLAGHPSVWAPTPQSTATAEPPAIQTWKPEDRSHSSRISAPTDSSRPAPGCYNRNEAGAVLGVRWRDLDLEAGRVSITHTVIAGPHGRSYVDAQERARTLRRARCTTVAALRTHRARRRSPSTSTRTRYPRCRKTRRRVGSPFER